jgi:hypothetical protein
MRIDSRAHQLDLAVWQNRKIKNVQLATWQNTEIAM